MGAANAVDVPLGAFYGTGGPPSVSVLDWSSFARSGREHVLAGPALVDADDAKAVVVGEVAEVLDVESGERRSRARQQAAIQVSFTGLGRPRRSAWACSSPQRAATRSEYGSVTTCCRQSASEASLRGPQLRSTVQLVSSPTVTNEMHQV
jgi:hypothetical protein